MRSLMNILCRWREMHSYAEKAETQRTQRKPGERGGALVTPRILRVLKHFSASCAVIFSALRERRLRLILASLLPCLLALPVFAGTIAGTVRNGTTNQPASGVQITLIRLQGGMEEAASTKTDAQGRYSLSDPGLGQGPMLLRADYKGVTYFQPAPPGQTTADIQVYEHTEKLSSFSVA